MVHRLKVKIAALMNDWLLRALKRYFRVKVETEYNETHHTLFVTVAYLWDGKLIQRDTDEIKIK